MTPRFLVVVPAFNAMPWLKTCLDSIATQSYPDFGVVVVDDASTDPEMWPTVLDICASYNWIGVHNDTNLRMPRNLRVAVRLMEPEPDDVIVIVDGDDWLPHSEVLSYLAEVYEDPDVWLTWGSYTRYPDPSVMPNPACPWPPDVIATRSYRSTYHVTAFNHPLTFRKHLWDHVTDADLQDSNGNWLTAGYDAAIMFPMTEMAGPEHFRFLSPVLYVYNEGNPISDGKVRPMECDYAHNQVRGRPPKEPLDGVR